MQDEKPINAETSELEFDAPDKVRLKHLADNSAYKDEVTVVTSGEQIAKPEQDNGTKVDWSLFEQNFRELCISLAAFFLIPGIESAGRLLGYAQQASSLVPLGAVLLNLLWMLKCSVCLIICSHGASDQRQAIRTRGGLLVSGTFALFLSAHFLTALFTGQFEANKWNIWYEMALLLIFGPILLFFALRSNRWFTAQAGYDVFGFIFCAPYILFGFQLLMGPGFVARFLMHPLGVWLVGGCMCWHIIGSALCLKAQKRPVHIILFCLFSLPLVLVAMMGPAIITLLTMH